MTQTSITTSLLAFFLVTGVCVSETNTTERPAEWAQPVALDGVPNLHRVTPGLYRSAQPTAEGMKNIEKLGIKTVINLRSFHTDKDEIKGTALQGISIPINTWELSEQHVVQFLQAVTATNRAPVLVHCQHGADRTGTMCAMYRMAVQGWAREAAIREMTDGKFGFHAVWDNLIDFLKKVDVEAIRRKAGIAPAKNPAAGSQPGA